MAWTLWRYRAGVLHTVSANLVLEFQAREWEEVGEWWLVPKAGQPYLDVHDTFAVPEHGPEHGRKRIVLSRRPINDKCRA